MATPTIESLHEQWIAAFNAHDLDQHIALYTDDATLFGAVPELKIGREDIRSYFGNRGPNVRVAKYPFPHITMLGEDVATTAAHVDFADGETPMPYRVTWILVRHNGDWKIAQHHGSPRG